MSIVKFLPILALAAGLGLPVAAQAQTASPAPDPAMSAPPMGGSHHRHRESLMHALRSLNLTAAQKQQVATFHSQEQQANVNADPQTKHANAMKMRSQIMGVLTDDQKAQLQAKMQRSRGRGDAPAPDGSQPNPAPSPASR